MIVFSNTITPRLQYILNFFGRQIVGEPFTITTDAKRFKDVSGPKINYSSDRIQDSEFWIANVGLLFDREIQPQNIECFTINGSKAFFKSRGDFDFDLFAASFYLMSRYEEYLPHNKDIYGRYAHENSLAFKENFLILPLVDIWIREFKLALKARFPNLETINTEFTFSPTYDIDEAFAYKAKQWWRTAGGLMRSLFNLQWRVVAKRMSVLFGNERDPYDSFGWMDALHEKFDLKPVYFFLVAAKIKGYDKNIPSSTKGMQLLIRSISEKYPIGIHPSWQSGDSVPALKEELLRLGHIAGKQIINSRQHYIRLSLPQTYRQLIELGIEHDYTMGYGSINGFRASLSTSFFWYDLLFERETKLVLHPFCYMEANSFYEQKHSAEEALAELRSYLTILKSVNGTFIMIWHNHFLGTTKLFEGWKDVYRKFIDEVMNPVI